MLLSHADARAGDGKLGKHLHLVTKNGDLVIEENTNEDSRRRHGHHKRHHRHSKHNDPNHNKKMYSLEISNDESKDDNDADADSNSDTVNNNTNNVKTSNCCIYWNCFKNNNR